MSNGEHESGRRKLEILEFVRYIYRKKLFVILPAVLTVLAVGMYLFFLAEPVYEATAQLYVVNSQDSVINLSDLQIGSYLTSDYQWVFSTWEVNQKVINQLQLPYTVKEMQDRLTVKNPSNTRILLITFASTDAKEAADVANTYASVASQYISDYMLTNPPSIISVALEPLTPARPRKKLILAFSLMICIFVTIWCLFIAFLLDDKIKTSADLKKYLNAEPLAVIPLQQKNTLKTRERGQP